MKPKHRAKRKAHDPYAAFRYSNYRYYTLGNFLSVMGQQMLRVAVNLEVWRQTHSLMASGLIGLFIWIPIFLFMLPGGMLADRYNRKALVLGCNLLFAFCACCLGLSVQLSQPVTFIFAFLFLIGVARAFSDPPKNALLPELVPQKHFTNAITWNSNIFQIASVVGPALGGFFYSQIGFSNVCWIDVSIEIIFFIFILIVRQSASPYKREPISLHSLLQGLKFVRNNKLILATITMDLFAVILGGATALFPAFDDKVLHCGATGVGSPDRHRIGGLPDFIPGGPHPHEKGGSDASLGRGWLRAGHYCLRPIPLVLAVIANDVPGRGLRPHQRDRSAHAGPGPHAQYHAGTHHLRQLHLHPFLERIGRV